MPAPTTSFLFTVWRYATVSFSFFLLSSLSLFLTSSFFSLFLYLHTQTTPDKRLLSLLWLGHKFVCLVHSAYYFVLSSSSSPSSFSSSTSTPVPHPDRAQSDNIDIEASSSSTRQPLAPIALPYLRKIWVFPIAYYRKQSPAPSSSSSTTVPHTLLSILYLVPSYITLFKRYSESESESASGSSVSERVSREFLFPVYHREHTAKYAQWSVLWFFHPRACFLHNYRELQG